MAKRNPTIADVLHTVEQLARSTAKQFAKADDRFQKTDQHFHVISDDLRILKDDMSDVKRSLRGVGSLVADHEQRVSRLEDR